MSTHTDTDHRSDAERTAAQRFRAAAGGHAMTILHEQGPYRHLRFANADSGMYAYDLITWPHGLTFRGDGPNFVFSVFPTTDLFDLFRGSSHAGINPGYWQEKVMAGQVKDWSEDKFRAWVRAEGERLEATVPHICDALRADVLSSDEYNLEYEEVAREAIANFSYQGHTLRFPREWEVSFQDWSWEFLWACHGILAGIATYDAVKGAADTTVPEASNR